MRKEFGLEVFTHALLDAAWPPTDWSHDRAAWTVEAKFIINDYGLRNRMAIITETPGQPTFERRIYAQYAYIMALLEYTNAHAAEIRAVVKQADDETVARVQARAESGELRNFLDGEYQSRGQDRRLAYRHERRRSICRERASSGTKPGTACGKPETVTVEDLTMPVGTREASVPRGYLIPANDAGRRRQTPRAQHHASARSRSRAKSTASRSRFHGVRKVRRAGYDMMTLDGNFAAQQAREFPPGRSSSTWLSRWRTRRSTTSSRRRATDSSGGVFSTHGSAGPASIRSSNTVARRGDDESGQPRLRGDGAMSRVECHRAADHQRLPQRNAISEYRTISAERVGDVDCRAG